MGRPEAAQQTASRAPAVMLVNTARQQQQNCAPFTQVPAPSHVPSGQGSPSSFGL